MGPGTNDDEAGAPDDTSDDHVRAGMVVGLFAYAQARGLPREELLACMELSLPDLLDPEARVPDRALHLLWRRLAAHCPGEAVGLHLASVAPLTDFGVLLHAVRFTRTMHEALRMFVRYSDLIAGRLEVRLVEGPEHTALHMHHPLDDLDGGHLAEMALALTARLGRESFGSDGALDHVELRSVPHGPLDQYTSTFGVPVRFEQPHNAIVFRTADFSIPVRRGDAHTLEYLQAHFEAVRQRFAPAPTDDLAPVHVAIATNAERGEYGAEALAKQLGMGLRTLQRMLREHDTTVAALLEQAREANARALLGDPQIGVDEVAFVLGYSSARAFRRACIRWTGLPPSELRAQLVSG
ncbi:AraC family transcriptional regulator [Paraliomyxa miuraensis]|uniref:AraC family transcriptional regulator n=1 Tax=Paraliomyxa miuraensis TaxID=376150 RepID=UPI0022523698|nr:AraC family transcriptional regulator [Paraliomyxa miuraensis]MCX4241823.1 AraC family transcriptional regulator [Paraliomyxa miuraensis]